MTTKLLGGESNCANHLANICVFIDVSSSGMAAYLLCVECIAGHQLDLEHSNIGIKLVSTTSYAPGKIENRETR